MKFYKETFHFLFSSVRVKLSEQLPSDLVVTYNKWHTGGFLGTLLSFCMLAKYFERAFLNMNYCLIYRLYTGKENAVEICQMLEKEMQMEDNKLSLQLCSPIGSKS